MNQLTRPTCTMTRLHTYASQVSRFTSRLFIGATEEPDGLMAENPFVSVS